MSNANPFVDARPFRQVRLAGWLVPLQLVAIAGVELSDEWAVQRAIGNNGWSTIWRGTKPNENLVLTFQASNKSGFDSLYEFYDRFGPKGIARPPTFTIENPIPNFIKVKRVSRKSWKGPYQTPSLAWRVEFGFIQYFPLVLAKVGPQQPAKLPGDPAPIDEGEKLMKFIGDKIKGL